MDTPGTSRGRSRRLTAEQAIVMFQNLYHDLSDSEESDSDCDSGRLEFDSSDESDSDSEDRGSNQSLVARLGSCFVFRTYFQL